MPNVTGRARIPLLRQRNARRKPPQPTLFEGRGRRPALLRSGRGELAGGAAAPWQRRSHLITACGLFVLAAAPGASHRGQVGDPQTLVFYIDENIIIMPGPPGHLPTRVYPHRPTLKSLAKRPHRRLKASPPEEWGLLKGVRIQVHAGGPLALLDSHESNGGDPHSSLKCARTLTMRPPREVGRAKALSRLARGAPHPLISIGPAP